MLYYILSYTIYRQFIVLYASGGLTIVILVRSMVGVLVSPGNYQSYDISASQALFGTFPFRAHVSFIHSSIAINLVSVFYSCFTFAITTRNTSCITYTSRAWDPRSLQFILDNPLYFIAKLPQCYRSNDLVDHTKPNHHTLYYTILYYIHYTLYYSLQHGREFCTHDTLHTKHYAHHITHNILHSVYYPQYTTHNTLLTSHNTLPTTHNPQPTTHYPQHTTHNTLPAIHNTMVQLLQFRIMLYFSQ